MVTFFNRGDADLSTLCWEKLGTGLDAGLKDKVTNNLFWSHVKLKVQIVWMSFLYHIGQTNTTCRLFG